MVNNVTKDKNLGGYAYNGENLRNYLNKIGKYSLLDIEEEGLHINKWLKKQDNKSSNILITSHLRLVVKLAMKYRYYSVAIEDLISEGNLGLIKALEKFEPKYGTRFSTYAIWWIRAYMVDYILNTVSIVKLGGITAQRKLFFGLKKIKSNLNINENVELSPDDASKLSKHFDISEKSVYSMNRRLTQTDLSLNTLLGDEKKVELQDLVVSEPDNPEKIISEKQSTRSIDQLITVSMKSLSQRERDILNKRWLSDKKSTLETLGVEYGISRERVRQIEKNAFTTLKKKILIQAKGGQNIADLLAM